MRRLIRWMGCALMALSAAGAPLALGAGSKGAPIKVALDAEFGVRESASAQSIRAGMQIAIDEYAEDGALEPLSAP